MKLLYLALSFLALILLDFYLKTNISGIGEQGINLPVLALFVVLAGVLFLWRATMAKSIVIRRSTWLLLLFLAYFIFRIGIDIGEMDRLKAYTLATSGGVILFYILGTLVAVIIGQHPKNAVQAKNYFKYFTLFFIGYLVISYGLLLSVFFELGARLRTDILLLEDAGGAYQRPGNFLVIGYLMLITLYAQFISLKQTQNSLLWVRLSSLAAFGVFIIYTLTALLIAQMIGSNNATVLIAGLGLIVIAILMLLWLKSVRNYLSVKPLTFTRLTFGKVTSRLAVFGVLALVLLIGVILSVSNYLGIDLTMTRLGGFGSGEVSSVSSRLALLDNFAIQFAHSPFFGNMNVDCLTTGCGSYVHSLLATLLTHTGFIGFFLFTFYLVLAYKERFKLILTSSSNFTLKSNIVNLYAILFVSAILVIGVLATSLTWATLWFSLGLLMTGIGFKGNDK